jgi:hypothetical protein
MAGAIPPYVALDAAGARALGVEVKVTVAGQMMILMPRDV